MVIDSSALTAILLQEPDAETLSRAIRDDEVRLMAGPTYLEAAMVVESRRGPAGVLYFDALVERMHLDVAPFTKEHADVARDAFRVFGRGRHPAKLNLGDCISYAFAKVTGEPLLYKGNDFAHTDIRSAL